MEIWEKTWGGGGMLFVDAGLEMWVGDVGGGCVWYVNHNVIFLIPLFYM